MNLKRIILAAAIGLQLATGAVAQMVYSAPYIGDRVIYVDTVADMLALPAGKSLNGQVVVTKRYSTSHTVGDGSGNAYRSDTSEGGTPDGGFVINDTGTHWHAVDKSVCNVAHFGAVPNDAGSAATNVAAVNAAIAAAEAKATDGAMVYFPQGRWFVNEGFTISGNSNIGFYGDSPLGSRIRIQGNTGDVTLFYFDNTTASANYLVKDLGVDAPAELTYTKVAFHLDDVSNFKIQNVYIALRGTDSTGVRVSGREKITLDNVRIRAQVGVRVSENPNVSGVSENSADMLVLRECSVNLYSTHASQTLPSASFLVDDGALFHNLLIQANTWVGGKYGFYHAGATDFSGTRYFAAAIRDTRCEQLTGTGAAFVYLTCHANAALMNLKLDNCVCTDAGAIGLYARNIENVLIDSSWLHMTTADMVDVDGVQSMTWNSVESHFSTASATIANLSLVDSYYQANYPLPFSARWTNGDEPQVATGTYAIDPGRACEIDSSGGAVTATLGDGSRVGQKITIVMTNASNSSTVSVTNHVTSDPEVFTFDAVDEYLVLMWSGTEWVTIAGDATT